MLHVADLVDQLAGGGVQPVIENPILEGGFGKCQAEGEREELESGMMRWVLLFSPFGCNNSTFPA